VFSKQKFPQIGNSKFQIPNFKLEIGMRKLVIIFISPPLQTISLDYLTRGGVRGEEPKKIKSKQKEKPPDHAQRKTTRGFLWTVKSGGLEWPLRDGRR
jgi:hypothetical protein